MKKLREKSNSWLAWLEKQAEQKPTDKFEPKFKVGDWIVKNDDSPIHIDYSCCKIIKIENGNYTIESIYGYKGYNTFETFEKNYHLWTIQDAKDGDVLCCESGWTCIFKTLVNDETFSSYCFMDKTKWFCETGSEGHTLKEEFIKAYNGKIYPATKEQRDTLFAKMKEVGYTFDFEKKELKKIGQKPIEEVNGEDYGIDGLWHAQRILEKTLGSVDGYQSDDGILSHKAAITAVKKLCEQKTSEWSEEDEKYSSYICAALDCYYRLREDRNNTNGQEDLDKARNWLYNKLKFLRPQNKLKLSAWSEEDEKQARQIERIVHDDGCTQKLQEQIADWLKSIKDRVQAQNFTVTDEELAQAKKDAYNDSLDKIEYHSGEPTFDDGWDAAIWYLKKKNAQTQSQWKPSYEQMKALGVATNISNVPEKEYIELEKLHQDLKKLMEE